MDTGVKKSIVAILVILALVVLISPGIVGRLAEKSVDENLNWAAEESREVVVQSKRFDRGWFSSEGQHRIEVLDGTVRESLQQFMGDLAADELPVLIIDTHLDHGLIPVTSMSRDKGSLFPGLGSAISTMSIEMPGGETLDVPGTIYSAVGLTGELESNFVLEPGSLSGEEVTASWGATDVSVTASPTTNALDYDGVVESLRLGAEGRTVDLGPLSFVGNQVPSGYGFSLGQMKLELDSIAQNEPGGSSMQLGPFVFDARSSMVDDRLTADTKASFAGIPAPGIGDLNVVLDIGLSDVEPRSLGQVIAALEALDPNVEDPTAIFGATSEPLEDVLAAGLKLDIRQLDVQLPQGTVAATLAATVQESDPAAFAWTSLLLATEGTAELVVPEAVMEFILSMNPQAGAAVGMGFLRKNGDVYELKAEYKKGLLTVNGAPMPIPLSAR